MTAPPRHDVICRFGMAVMCPLMMSLNYRAGSVIDSNSAQDNLLSNFAPDEQTVRRPPRSLHSTVSTPQYRGYYGCAAAPYRRCAKYATLLRGERKRAGDGKCVPRVPRHRRALRRASGPSYEYSRLYSLCSPLMVQLSTCRSLPSARPTAPASTHVGAHAAPMQCLLGCGPTGSTGCSGCSFAGGVMCFALSLCRRSTCRANA